MYGEYRKNYKHALNRRKIHYIKEYVSKTKPKRLLDLGCGRGMISLELKGIPGVICGIDIDEKKIKLAAKFAEEIGADNVFFAIGDAKKIPFKNDAFDMVICSQVLEHIPDPEAVIEEIIRVSNDAVLIDVPTPIWEIWHFFYYIIDKVRHPWRTLRRIYEINKRGEWSNPSIEMPIKRGHVNKLTPKKWTEQVRGCGGVKLIETSACHISPIRSHNLLWFLEEKIRKRYPYSHMGMVFFMYMRKKIG